MRVQPNGRERGSRRRWQAAGAALLALGAIVPIAALGASAAPPPPPPPPPSTGPSLFSTSRSLAIEAAKVRLNLYVQANPADVAVAEPVACPLVAPEVLAAAAATVSAADGVDLRLHLDPWTGQTTMEPELRPSSAAPGTVSGLSVISCNSAPPDDATLTRPSLAALVLRSGVTFRDVGRLYGVEPILPVAAAGIGGQVAGSCLASAATGVCVVIWQSLNLVLGMTLEGPPAAVNVATPADLLTAAVPGIVDSLAVQIASPRLCDATTIQADTGVALVGEPICHDGWAISSGMECPPEPSQPASTIAPTPCPNREVFHIESDGWEHNGAFDATCAETLARLGMTGNTARAFRDPCDPADASLRYVAARPGDVGRQVRAVQTALVAIGYVMPVDGRYGPLTQAAVVDYQTRNNLTVDGVAGQQTQASLGI